VGHEPTSVGQANLDAARIDQEQALAEYREQVLDHVTEMYEEKEDAQVDVDAAIVKRADGLGAGLLHRIRVGEDAEELMKDHRAASLILALGLGVMVGYMIRRSTE
jgi:hypothetical protein